MNENPAQSQPPTRDLESSGMLRSITRLLVAIAFGSLLVLTTIPLAAPIYRRAVSTQAPNLFTGAFLVRGALLAIAVLLLSAAVYYLLRKAEPFLDSDAVLQAHFLDTSNERYVDLAIVFSAALSLFLELAVIRWQSSVMEFLAFYKNFSLLACFAGLGLGYALANRSRIPLILVAPLLAWQFVLMMITRTLPDLFHAIPFREQLSMGVDAAGWKHSIVIYLLLTVVFLITGLTFIPIGQLCGRLMERRSKLRAYGLNLLGSLAGVVLMLIASSLWTPPLVWFSLCFLGIIAFQVRRPVTLYATVGFVLAAAIVLSWWPVDRLWNRVYSPYQLLEIGTSDDTGLTLIRAAGHYYQRIHNLSGPNLPEKLRYIRDYYDFPYKVQKAPADVAVVGAGTGNDVMAALRAGAKHVDAIEIDPAILLVGKERHPEKPYDSPRVTTVNTDARSFLRGTDRKYDLIVYGLLDSHTLLTQGSSVRLDSFVYTVEGFREARSRLKPDGVVSLAFTILSDGLGRKMYLMLKEAFDGRPPVCVKADYDRAVIFVESNNPSAALAAPAATSGFQDVTSFYANPSLQADVSTDDWPFFYMPRRIYPISYVVVVLQMLVLSLVLGWSFLGEAPRFSHLSFFFLGAGFMLVETKGITEMGLTFGNTWQVIGVVISGILVMAFAGNCAVAWLKIRRPMIPYLLLWSALAIGWQVARAGGFASTPLGRIETAITLTCPMLFSGIVFSTLLSSKGEISGMMAMNLLGAICGGLLEYNSMYFGFRFLYLIAMACYVLAFLSDLAFARRTAREPDHASAVARV